MTARASLPASCSLTAILLASCGPDSVALDITFATTALRRRAATVGLSVQRGGCTEADLGPAAPFHFEGAAGRPIGTPGELGPGAWSFRAWASDRECLVFARGCTELSLPGSSLRDHVEVLLGHVAPDPRCADGQLCLGGTCSERAELPRWSCPERWRRVTLDDPTLGPIESCEPLPRGDATCVGAEALLPGDPGCAPLWPPCEADEDGWPRDLPPGSFHVALGAAGGDGTRDRPFGTLAEAFAAAPEGAIIAASADVFEEADLELGRRIELRGSCGGRTVLEVPLELRGTAGRIAMSLGGGASLRDVTVRGGAPALRVRASQSASLQGVVVEEADIYGVDVEEFASLEARGLAVRATRDGMCPDSCGTGLHVRAGGSLDAGRLLLEDNARLGVDINGALSASGVSAAITVARFQRHGDLSMQVGTGGSVRLREAVIEGSPRGVRFDNSRGVLEDVVVRSVSEVAVEVWDRGSAVEIRRALLDAPTRVEVEDGTASLALRDVVVSGAGAPRALLLLGAYPVVLERAVLLDASRCALDASRSGPVAWCGGAVARAPVAVCLDRGDLDLEAAGVRGFDVSRAVRSGVASPSVELCDGCDSDADAIDDTLDADVVCAEDRDGEHGVCLRASATDGRDPVATHRCCIPSGPRGCEGTYGVAATSRRESGAEEALCCTL